MSVTTSIDAFLAGALRGGDAQWPAHWGQDQGRALVDRAIYHGIAANLLAREAALATLPLAVVEALRAHARGVGIRELRHRELLTAVLDSFAAAGLDPILLKGSALAYDLYPSPAMRERGDSDILVRPGDRQRAHRQLEELGFTVEIGEGMAEEYTLQQMWTRHLGDGMSHDIDLHVAPMNAPAYADRLTYADAADGARAIPALAAAARAPAYGFMLLHACLHWGISERAPYRIGRDFHYGGDRLIWLIDMRLLGQAMTGRDWTSFLGLARKMGEVGACRSALAAAHRQLGVPIPDDIAVALAQADAEPSAYMAAGPMAREVRDVRAIRGLGRKCGYLLNRLFPTRAFMRAKYPDRGAMLPLLYVRRVAEFARARDRAGRRQA